MREAILAALVVALAIALILVVTGEDEPDPETERWKEEAAAHQADADYWQKVAQEARAKFVADSIRSDSIIKAERRKSRAAERETDEGIESLDERAQAIVRPLLARERAQHASEVEALEAKHERAMTRIRAELDAKKAETTDLRETIAAHENRIERLEERLAPDINLLGLVRFDIECGPGAGIGSNEPLKPEVQVACLVPLT